MDDEDEPGLDCCNHGLGFDEDCEWCDYEIWLEDRQRWQLATTGQRDLFAVPNSEESFG